MSIQIFNPNELLEIKSQFLADLSSAWCLDDSCLHYNLNWLLKDNFLQSGEKTQVIYLGGSHVESCLVRLDKDQVKIEEFFSQAISPISSKENFLNLIESLLIPGTTRIKLNIAASTRSFLRGEVLDSVLIQNHRYHNLDFLVGSAIGLELENYLEAVKNQKYTISSCNNLVSLGFLASDRPNFNWKNTIVGIVASGTNFGFYENPNTFVNLESGKMVLQEREISEFINETSLLKAYSKLCKTSKSLTTNLEKDFWQAFNDSTDSDHQLVKNLLHRSAQLVAVKIASIIEFKGEKGWFDFDQKLEIIMEGSLFWNHKEYQNLVRENISKFLPELEFDFINVNFSFILGAISLSITTKPIVASLNIFTFFFDFKNSKTGFSLRAPPIL